MMGVPILIQEQNSYAGITNKILSKRASRICVAYPGMEAFFPAERILKTGNPVRANIVDIKGKHHAGAELLKLNPLKKTVLVTGGSLGAGTLNKSIENDNPARKFCEDNNITVLAEFQYEERLAKINSSGLIAARENVKFAEQFRQLLSAVKEAVW